jgi:Domain of unknown function (DUF5658)
MADHTTAINPERGRVTQLFVQYSYLQVLDFLTTIAFLLHGVREGNPLVRFFVSATANPINGLLVVKLLAVLIGIYCWRMGRGKVLARINIMFAALVAWNLVALILSSIQHTS